MKTARETLQQLADIAKANADEAREFAAGFQERADLLNEVLAKLPDEALEKLLDQMRHEAPSIFPS